MIKSMTGFASVTHEDETVSLTVTVRSLNHRFLDVQTRVPSGFVELEHDLRGLVQKHLARGRVELTLTARVKTASPVEVDINEPLVAALVETGERARERGWVDAGLSVGELLRFPQAVTVREVPTEPEIWRAACKRVSEGTVKALTELDEMRRREGAFLQTDLDERRAAIGGLVNQIVSEAETGADDLRARLVTRIEELGAVPSEPAVVTQEVVKWVARSDIHEEVARLRGHLEHLEEVAAAAEPCGRKLDFLVQEMNREVNTIGSKAEGRHVGQLVVAAKAELEKLREQIQNVE